MPIFFYKISLLFSVRPDPADYMKVITMKSHAKTDFNNQEIFGRKIRELHFIATIFIAWNVDLSHFYNFAAFDCCIFAVNYHQYIL